MKTKLALTAIVALIALAALTGMKTAPAEAVRDGVFIHISHGTDDPHRALMALQMAVKMSEDRDVLVYCDIKAISLVLKDSPELETAPFPSLKTQLAALRDADVTVMACPGCLAAAGKTVEDLAEGIIVADKEGFFDFTRGRILTLDY